MLSTSHNCVAPPTIEPYRAPVLSVRASLDSARRENIRTATPVPRSEVKSDSFSNHADSSTLFNMLGELFQQFFTQLQTLLRGDVRPVEPKNNDLPVPPRPAPPTPDTKSTDKQGEPIPELSNKSEGSKPANVFSGFRQGRNGNCVTISAIKAAMEKFGQSPKDIYKSVEKTTDGFKVVMRDDVTVKLSKAELASAIRGSNFVGLSDPGMLKDAHFLFACSAKRAQSENNDGWAGRSFEAAIRSLNDGEDEWGPGEGFKRLGLKDHMKRVSVRDFVADKSLIGMVNRRGHSVAVVDGSEELYGRKSGRPTGGDAIALIDRKV
ncbi:hypothetical protein ACW9I8_23935 [Pseudomonas reactans]